MPLRSLITAAILTFAASTCLATPQLRNVTGLWQNPGESGWGLNLFHQGDTLFGALFVYGSDGRPRWYVASNLASNDDGPLHDKATTYSGALYEATGPWFGGAFDPASVTRREAGTLRLQVGATSSTLDYTIDGVSISKAVQPFGFRGTDLSGHYVGYVYQPASTPAGEIRNAVQMTIQASGSAVHIAQSGTNGSCTYDGTLGQNGQLTTVSGTYAGCGGSGPFSMSVDMTPDGLTGSFAGGGVSAPWGRIALSRLDAGLQEGNGWRTDLWFPPNESGWGLNVVEQGDTIFATIFVYDAQGASHWYVASALTRSPARADGTAVFTGPLYEATGPYYAAAFDPNAVTRRQVGTMSFDVRDRGTATLAYTVDGVSVTKAVARFAFRKNNLSGNYLGHLASTADDPNGSHDEAMSISIDDGDAGFVMRTQPQGATQPRSGASCTYTAPPPAQFGEQRLVTGNYTCANGDAGAFTMDNAFVTFNGFTATFQGAWVTKGHMEGVRIITVPDTPPPPPPATPKFSFVGNAIATANGQGQVSIQRSGSTAGAIVVNYAFSGSSCAVTTGGGSVSFGDGDAGTKTVTVPMGPSGQCDVVLVSATAPAELVAPRTATVTVVPQVAGCPAPSNVVTNTVTGFGNPLLQRQASGVTVFIPLPPPDRPSTQVTFSESAGGAFTPQPVTLEISINKCPGIIDTDTGNFCNLRTSNGSINSITFLSQPAGNIDRTNANSRGYCWAGDGGQYYVNARWTYPGCPSGVDVCGFAIQYNPGPF